MVRCADSSLYTGIAKDIEKRIEAHNAGKLGAKYTKARRPVRLVYQETAESRSQATRREIEIKRMNKADKELLVKYSDNRKQKR